MKNKSRFKLTLGFTLIELLVVIAVIGILAAGITSVINPAAQFQKANDARRKADLSQIEKALETFYQDNGKYPDSTSATDKFTIKGSDGVTVPWGSQWGQYMGTLPKDQNSSKNYVYYSSGGQTYYLYASLDRGANDSQACNSGDPCASLETNSIPSTSCGGDCNYGVSTPNVSP